MEAKEYLELVKKSAAYIQAQDSRRPEIAIILGSGLGKLGDKIENQKIIPYKDIPGFLQSTAIGHKGNLIIGELGGKTVLAMQGRFHYYEGYTMQELTLPQRVMKFLGIKYLFVSNAAGGLNSDYRVGTMMVIKDHINMAPNPLIGTNLEEFGPRFPDMTHAYAPELITLADKCAEKLGYKLEKGVYVAVTGPTFETPAECRCYHNMGADAIGMSTVPEVIVARQCGIKVFGISIITDEASFDREDDYSVSGEEVIIAADAAADRMTALFQAVIREVEL